MTDVGANIRQGQILTKCREIRKMYCVFKFDERSRIPRVKSQRQRLSGCQMVYDNIGQEIDLPPKSNRDMEFSNTFSVPEVPMLVKS